MQFRIYWRVNEGDGRSMWVRWDRYLTFSSLDKTIKLPCMLPQRPSPPFISISPWLESAGMDAFRFRISVPQFTARLSLSLHRIVTYCCWFSGLYVPQSVFTHWVSINTWKLIDSYTASHSNRPRGCISDGLAITIGSLHSSITRSAKLISPSSRRRTFHPPFIP